MSRACLEFESVHATRARAQLSQRTQTQIQQEGLPPVPDDNEDELADLSDTADLDDGPPPSDVSQERERVPRDHRRSALE